MEYIEGIRMDRIDEIRAQNIDPKEIAMIGLVCVLFPAS
jgi:predicted unusual protein kinase regulating ubiquinone biosynthesis (AarF/ABC1/UbiB family)